MATINSTSLTTEKPEAMTRQIAPDFLKGLCISLMVYGHIAYIGDLASQQNSLSFFIYTFHMPIFLMISGFFFEFSENLKSTALKIIHRIGVPYVLFISLYLIGLTVVKEIGIPTSNPPPANIQGFFMAITINPYGGYWFLHSLLLIQLSILFAAAISSTSGKSQILTLLLALTLFLFLDLLGLVSMRTSTYFFIGLLLGLQTKKVFSVPIVPITFGTILFLIVSSFDASGIYAKGSVFEVTWCLLLFSFLWSISAIYHYTLPVKILAWVGRNSLSILVLHSLFIVSMKPFNRLFLQTDSSGLLQSIFVSISTIIFCLLSSKAIDKADLSKFIFGVLNIYSELNLADRSRKHEKKKAMIESE